MRCSFALVYVWCVVQVLALPEDSINDTVPMNHLQALGTHNSYHIYGPKAYRDTLAFLEQDVLSAPQIQSLGWQYAHPPMDQQATFQHVRQFELDLFLDPDPLPTVGGQQESRYYRQRGLAVLGRVNEREPDNSGNLMRMAGTKVLHITDIDPWTNCFTLDECTDVLLQWSNQPANQGHMPILVLLELKDSKTPDPMNLGVATPPLWTTLDRAELANFIQTKFGDKLLSPDWILTNHTNGEPNLRTAIQNSGWPQLGDVRGKFFFLQITKQGLANSTTGYGDAIFVDGNCAGDTLASCDDNVVVKTATDLSTADNLAQDGVIVRARTDSNTNQARNGNTTRRDVLVPSAVHFISTDYPFPSIPGFLPSEGGVDTNFTVSLQPRCNPHFLAGDPCVTVFEQSIVTPPASPNFAITNDFDLDTSQFFANFQFDASKDLIEGWASVAGLETPVPTLSAAFLNYLPPSFSPSTYAKNMRDTPRVGGASSEWNDNADDQQDHVIAIVAFGVPVLVFAFLWLLCSPLCLCPCCKRCKTKLRSKDEFGNSAGAKKFTICMIIVLVLAVIGAVLAFTGVGLMRTGVNNTTDEARGIAAIVDRAINTADVLASSVDSINGFSDNILAFCPNASAALSISNANLPNTTEITENVDDVRDIPKDIRSAATDIDDYADLVVSVALVFLVALVVLLLFLVCLGYRATKQGGLSKCTQCGVRCVATPLGIFSIFVLLFVSAFLLIISAGLSDFCADKDGGPDAVILRLVDNGTDSYDFVRFRLTCQGVNDLLENDLVDLNQTTDAHLGLDFSPVLVLGAAECPNVTNVTARYQAAINDLQPPLLAVDQAVLLYKEIVACKTFNELYVNTVHVALCDNLLTGFVLLWIGSLMLSLFMGCILCVSGRRALGVEKDPGSAVAPLKGEQEDSIALADLPPVPGGSGHTARPL